MLQRVLCSLTLLCALQKSGGTCTLPVDLRGRWHASDIGVLVFNDTHMTTYNSVVVFGPKVVECYDISDGRYLLVSNSFFYLNSQFQLGFCWEFEAISATKYIYYPAVGVLQNTTNSRIVFKEAGTPFNASTDCTLSAPYDPWITRMLIKDGYSDVEATSCPDSISGAFNYTFTSSSGSNCFGNSTLEVCSEGMTFDYSECSTVQGYSAAGNLYCVNYTTVGGYDYLITYNRDPASILDEALYHRYTCYVISNDTSDPSVRHMTQHPQACMESQTPTSYTSPGGYIQLLVDGICEINVTTTEVPTTSSTATSTPASSVLSASVVITAVILIVLLIIILVIVIIVCLKKKCKKNYVGPEYIVPPIKHLLKKAMEANKDPDNLPQRTESEVTFTKFELENDTNSTTAILTSREIDHSPNGYSVSSPRDSMLDIKHENYLNAKPQESKVLVTSENKPDVYTKNSDVNDKLTVDTEETNPVDDDDERKTQIHGGNDKNESGGGGNYIYDEHDSKDIVFDEAIGSNPQIYPDEEVKDTGGGSPVEDSKFTDSITVNESEPQSQIEKDDTNNDPDFDSRVYIDFSQSKRTKIEDKHEVQFGTIDEGLESSVTLQKETDNVSESLEEENQQNIISIPS